MPPRGLLHRVALALLVVLAAACATPDEARVAHPPMERPTAPESPAPDGTVEVEPGPPPDVEEPEAPDDQIRGVWIHLFDPTLKSAASIEQAVDVIADAGANTIFAQVARRHDAYYASQILPPTPDPELEPGLDVLDALLAAAERRNLDVHAWIGIAPTWHEVYADLDPPAGWVATEHGVDAPVEQRWVTRGVDGAWSDYLDPALPQVREHVAAVAVELAERYPVDGIHLDYARYPSERHGYHPAALDRFAAETGRTDVPEPRDEQWSQWRRDQSRDLVAHVRGALDETGRDVTLSAAVITWGAGPADMSPDAFARTRPGAEALQDWPSWVREGIVDMAVPMNYFRAHDTDQANWFAQWLAFENELASTSTTAVVPGIGGWLNQPDAVVEQIASAVAAGDGAVVYSFQQPADTDADEVWRALAQHGWDRHGG